jgi:uncharacterized membrane protein
MNNRWFAPFCIGLMLLAGVFALPHMPEQVPVHWNLQGEVDGYSSRWFAVLFMPAVSFVVFVLFRALPGRDPVSSSESNASLMARFGNWIVLFLLVVQLALLGNAIGLQFDFIRVILAGAGVLFVAIGNEMGRLKPNSWAGVRLPWTMTDEDVWRESNRMGGRGMVVAGLLTVLFAALLPADIVLYVVIAAMLGGVIFMIGYSYWVAEKKRKSMSN